MSKRKRRRHPARTRQNGAPRAATNPAPHAGKPKNAMSSGTGQANPQSEPQQPQAEWVTVEHRDADGNPTLPKDLVASTYRRRYSDVPPGTEITARVLAGYKPKPVLMVERKIYEVHRLSVRGWRRSGQIAVEVAGWRNHEADWFNAMQGVRLVISDPGLPGPHNDDSAYAISDSSFDRKIVTSPDERGNPTEVRLHEATLDITETWRSAWRRQGAEILSMGFKLLLLPLFAALGAGLALLWVDRSSWAGRDSDTREVPAQHADQPADGARTGEPSNQPANPEAPEAIASQAESDEQVSDDIPPGAPVAPQAPSH